MNVIQLLTNDHREVDDLFEATARTDGTGSIKDLTDKIVHELSVHAAVEEQFVYPFLRAKVDNGDDMADESIDEHKQAKRLLSDLESQQPGSTEHRQTLSQLIAAVRHHVEEEENEMFPALRQAADDDTLERLGSVVEKAKGMVPTHPHPLVPGTATAQLVAGPWATIVDKTRDLVSR